MNLNDGMNAKMKKRGHGIQMLPLIIKSATTAGLLFAVWGVGWFKFGVSWVIGASAIYFAGRTYQKSLLEKEEEEEEKDTLASVDELPTWVYFPDVERAEWLNKMVQQMWPYIGAHVCKTIRGMEGMIEENIPSVLRPFKFEEITLGEIPPRVGGLKVYIDNVKRDEIVMDVEISYSGDCDINVSLKSLHAGIKDVLLHGVARVIMRPLINKIPLIGGVEVCFLRPPDLHFDLTNIANILDVPFVNDTLLKVISDQLCNIVVLPNFIRVELASGSSTSTSAGMGGVVGFGGGAQLNIPLAIISVSIVEADDLKRSDAGKVFGKGKSDPYAQVIVGGVTCSTKYVKNTINPRWQESFEFMIAEMSSQMEIRVYDHDDHMDDDFLGNKYIKIQELADKKHMDEWLKLANIKTGRIHLIADIFYPTINPLDPNRVRQKQGANAVLMIAVESAKDLSTQSKGLVEPSPIVNLLLGNYKKQTTIKSKTINPRWDESFEMLVTNTESEMLFVQVQDSSKADEIMGTVTFKLKSLLIDNADMTVNRPFPLRDSKCNSFLTMKLSLRYLTTTPPTPPPSTPGPFDNQGGPLDNQEGEVFKGEVENLQSPFKGEAGDKEGARFRGKKTNSDTNRGRVQLTLHHNNDKLFLTVHKAADLVAHDKDHFSDPYVNLYLKPDESGSTKKKTEVIKNNLNPSWDESFEWPLKSDDLKNRSVEVTVKNHIGVFEKNTEKWMGVVMLDLCNYDNLEIPITDWFYLQDPTLSI